MLREELVVQVETAEDHVDLRHVVVVVGMKRVVQNRNVRTGGIEQPQILKAAGAVDVRQKSMEELQIALPVEDHHRNLVTIAVTADMAHKILRDDVAEQRCLSRSSLTEN